jgi:PKD repeat protein
MDNNPPEGTIVNPSGDITVATGVPVSFVATASDPDGDDVTGMEWDFGDDITASGLEVTHTYSEAGSYVVSFTATDEHGLADPTPDTRTITVTVTTAATFTQVQSEIFDQSCAFSGCHGGGSASSGLSLSAGAAYGNIVNVPSVQQPSVDRIEPLDPASSYLWLKVTGDSSISGAQMPRGGTPLTQDKLDLLRSWIEAGAEDN